MSIIFEGVDGVGKTTAAIRYVRNNLEAHYIHNYAKPKEEINQRSEITKELLLLSSEHELALDRSYMISEYVYSKVFNRPTIVTIEELQRLVYILNKHNHVVKFMTYTMLSDLRLKDEDKDLPFAELDMAYRVLFNELDITNLFSEYMMKGVTNANNKSEV